MGPKCDCVGDCGPVADPGRASGNDEDDDKDDERRQMQKAKAAANKQAQLQWGGTQQQEQPSAQPVSDAAAGGPSSSGRTLQVEDDPRVPIKVVPEAAEVGRLDAELQLLAAQVQESGFAPSPGPTEPLEQQRLSMSMQGAFRVGPSLTLDHDEDDGTEQRQDAEVELDVHFAHHVKATIVVDDECFIRASLVDEDAAEKTAGREKDRRKIARLKKSLAAAAVVVAVAVIASSVGMGVTSSRSDGGGGTGRTGLPTVDPDRLESIRAIVSPLLGSGNDSFDPDSPTFSPDRLAALDWSVRDLLQLPTNDPSLEWKIRQRYVMALFYIATNGPNWHEQFNFLSDWDECEWIRASYNQETENIFGGDYHSVELKGVICDMQGRVMSLRLCKYI